ncbi:MAG: class I SAM-dependent methyltransferase [Pirellulales bacterium]|nr:class I SAM-dependent methyltransferase [Pirellulales bacterium]
MNGLISSSQRTLSAALLAVVTCTVGIAPLAAQRLETPPAARQRNELAKLAEIPPALTHYMGREIAPYMTSDGAGWLVRKSRESEEDCTTLLKTLNIKPGQTVCDMGSGNGFYSLKLARLVGTEGQILAVDIQQEMLRLLEVRANEAKIGNIKSILGTPADPRLPSAQADLILCVDVYHEFSHPVQMLAAMKKALKPGGRLVLVEFRAEDPNVPIKPLHKMSKKQVLKELTANGFTLVEQFDKLQWQHVMFFVGQKE